MHTADNPNFVLNFGSFWSNIFQVSMSNPPLRVSSEVVHLAQNTSSRPAGLVPGSMEGAYEFQWKGFYYLFFSSGNCCNELGDGLAPPGDEYKVMICRSSEYGGSFVDQSGKDCLTQNGGTVVLESHHDVYAPGGQGVMFDPNLQSVVMYYHFVRPSVSYMYDDFFFGWNKLDFSSGWPVVVA
jgi:arabinan endo-1,5-alpha-L-arabinosidase